MTRCKDLPAGLARWAASAAISAIYTPIICGTALFSRRAAYRLFRRWSRAQPCVFGIDLEVAPNEPLEQDRGYVFLLWSF